LHEPRFDDVRVLSELLSTTDPWQLAGRVRLDFPRLVRTLKRLRRRGLLRISAADVTLTAQGQEAARRLGLRSRHDITSAFKRAKQEFRKLAGRRPASIGRYDQGYMTVDSLFRRAETIVRLGDADSKRLAILGDDDLLSIVLCLASRPESITVFEIDRRIVDFILDTAHKLSLPITAECRDLREPLPAKLKATCHTFITDPSETLPGLKMFLGRGLSLLRSGEGRAGYFGLTAIEASAEKWSTIQKWLLNNHATSITHIMPESAFYRNWPDILDQTECFRMECFHREPEDCWFNSSLIRLQTLRRFRPRATGRIVGSIFVDDEACGEIEGEVR
jgi:predicted methyltransferase